jgi:hypothetical protein
MAQKDRARKGRTKGAKRIAFDRRRFLGASHSNCVEFEVSCGPIVADRDLNAGGLLYDSAEK